MSEPTYEAASLAAARAAWAALTVILSDDAEHAQREDAAMLACCRTVVAAIKESRSTPTPTYEQVSAVAVAREELMLLLARVATGPPL